MPSEEHPAGNGSLPSISTLEHSSTNSRLPDAFMFKQHIHHKAFTCNNQDRAR